MTTVSTWHLKWDHLLKDSHWQPPWTFMKAMTGVMSVSCTLSQVKCHLKILKIRAALGDCRLQTVQSTVTDCVDSVYSENWPTLGSFGVIPIPDVDQHQKIPVVSGSNSGADGLLDLSCSSWLMAASRVSSRPSPWMKTNPYPGPGSLWSGSSLGMCRVCRVFFFKNGYLSLKYWTRFKFFTTHFCFASESLMGRRCCESFIPAPFLSLLLLGFFSWMDCTLFMQKWLNSALRRTTTAFFQPLWFCSPQATPATRGCPTPPRPS